MDRLLPIIVQKYGGSSVATHEKIRQIAQLISERAKAGNRLCVVVSAMGKTTDQLLSLALELSKNPSRRELDMLLSCGERASMALLAIALEELGCSAVSLTGSQSGIITSDVHSGAKILEVRPHRVLSELNKGKVVIVAGFQGISVNREITTLGRGGSDTTAVALAASLHAESCEIYSDVKGVYSADPNVVKEAVLLPKITLEEMEELSLYGAKVMHAQALQYARSAGIVIHALKTGDDTLSGTLISPEQVAEKLLRITVTSKERVIHLSGKGEAALETFFSILDEQRVGHVQAFGSNDDSIGKWNFLIHPEDSHGIDEWVKSLDCVKREPDCSTVTIVGIGLCDTPRVTLMVLRALKKSNFKINGINSAPNRSTFILDLGCGAAAVKQLHRELALLDIKLL